MSIEEKIFQKFETPIQQLQSVGEGTPTPPQNVIRLRIDDYFAFLHTFFVLDTKHDFLDASRVTKSTTRLKIDNLLNYYSRKLQTEYNLLTGNAPPITEVYGRMLQSTWYPKTAGSKSPGTNRTFEVEILNFYIQTVREIGQALADELQSNNGTTRSEKQREQNRINQLLECYSGAKKSKEEYGVRSNRQRMTYLNSAAATSIGKGKNKKTAYDTIDGTGSFRLTSKTGQLASFTFTGATFNDAGKYNIASFIDGAGSGIYNKTRKKFSPYELGNTNIKFICGNHEQVFISFKMNTAFVEVDGNNKLISKMWITRSYPDGSSSNFSTATAPFYFNLTDNYNVKVIDEIKNTAPSVHSAFGSNAGSIFYYANVSSPSSSSSSSSSSAAAPAPHDMVFISRKPFCDFGQSLNMFLINGGYQPRIPSSSSSSSAQQQAIEPTIIFDDDVIPSVNTQTNEILSFMPPSKRSRTSNVSSTSSVLPQVGFPVVSIHGDKPASGLAFFLISASALYRTPVSANRFLNEFPHIVYSATIPSKKERQKDIGKKFVFANKFGNIALTAHHMGGSGGSVPKPQAQTRKSSRKRDRISGGTREMFIDLRRDEIILCNKIFSQICLFNVDFSVVKIYNSYLKYLYDRDFKITWKKMAFARGRDGVWQKLFREVGGPEILSFINKLNEGTYINSPEYYEKLNIIKNSVDEDDLDEYFYDAYYYVKLLNSLPNDGDDVDADAVDPVSLDPMYFNNDKYSLRNILGFRSDQLPQIYNKLGTGTSPAKKAYSFVIQFVSNKKKSTKCRDIQPTQPTQSRQSRQQRQRQERNQPSTPNRPTQSPRASLSETDTEQFSSGESAQQARDHLLDGGYISYKKNKRKTRRRRRRRNKKKTRKKNKRKKKKKTRRRR